MQWQVNRKRLVRSLPGTVFAGFSRYSAFLSADWLGLRTVPGSQLEVAGRGPRTFTETASGA